jgi:cytochrome c-type biogenesis protein CcmH/NrfF
MSGLSAWAGFLWGLGGGVVAELLNLYGFRTLPTKPQYLKTFYYWLVTVGMILVGGGLVYAYIKSGSKIGVIVSAQLGAAAPLLLRTIIDKAPSADPGKVG